MANGKLFHKNGPEREKARSPKVVHFALGTDRRALSRERR